MKANVIELLLIKDNPNDVELTLRAMQKHNLANKVQVARDGLEVLRKMKAEERTKMIPVLLLLTSSLKSPRPPFSKGVCKQGGGEWSQRGYVRRSYG